jgi:hypothetical protein
LEHLWNDTDRGKPKFLEKNLSQSHVVWQEVLERCSASIFRWTEPVDVDAAVICRKKMCHSNLPV